ncbi:mitochondrial carrier domain-containing protein [Lipomyces oligophaga]|uniref:mitochondrial carrier domain-containing protein n=1 Tax=Lipomyces oligophaga TaxID=45792 RepID=UPI0034CFCDB9
MPQQQEPDQKQDDSTRYPVSLPDRESQIRVLFNTLDTQKQGYIDKDSLSDLFKNHPLEATDAVTNEVFNLLHKSGDDKIKFIEFQQFVERTEQHLWDLFQAIDKDHNGLLDRSELAAALQSTGLNVPSAALDRFFNSLDRDHDGFVTFKEWRDLLLFIPIENISLRSAYRYFIDSGPITSEGDVFLSDETLGGIGYFLSGGIAGAISRTATAPFDRLKVYMIAHTREAIPESVVATARTAAFAKASSTASSTVAANTATQARAAPALRSGVNGARSPMLEACVTIWRHGGLSNFFVGNGLNILKVFPESAIKFGSFEASKRLFASLEGTTVDEMSGISSFLAGGIGGAISQFSVYPVDTLKFRVQCEAESSTLRGQKLMIQTAKTMWHNGGILGYYRGIILGIGGIFPYAALDLGTFEAMKRAYTKTAAKQQGIAESEVKISNLVVLTMGALSGSVGASVVYPINFLRTRLQAQGTSAHPQTYTGMIDVFSKTVQHEGYLGMFRGLVPNLLKVAPAVSISYVVYENCKSLLGLR